MNSLSYKYIPDNEEDELGFKASTIPFPTPQ